jgi:geranylgeranyl diphosphate synthase, type II
LATTIPHSRRQVADKHASPIGKLAGPASELTIYYAQLMLVAGMMFEPQELERLAPRLRDGPALAEANGRAIERLDPLAATEAIAYDFLARGGKHSRPFITLAVYHALSGQGSVAPGQIQPLDLPDAIKRCALSIETFHKASLVHDDIEDDDRFRYGEPALHRRFGTATAINVGDYLVGMGYRLVTREAKTVGPQIICQILDRLAVAHMKLSEGQGAELIWRDSRNKQITTADALAIYSLKTAPAFGAALDMGARLAGGDGYAESFDHFARHLGVAFQIINDLNDWLPDAHNKLGAAGDVLGGRPTILWALALEGLSRHERQRLETLAAEQPISGEKLQQIRSLYEEADVFQKADRLIEKNQHEAAAIASQMEPAEMRRLFSYLIAMVLERRRPVDCHSASAALSALPTA